MVFVFFIPTIIVLMILQMIPFIGQLVYIVLIVFIVPWLTVNFFVKGTFVSLWELDKAFHKVFDNAIEYLIAYLKTLVYSVIYGLLSLILVGIPCYMFGQLFFIADFYRKHH